MTKETPTGITVIIVGLGIAGLTAAIECHRQGHKVIGIEKKSTVYQLGQSCVAYEPPNPRIIRESPR